MASKLGKIILGAVLPEDSTGLDLSAIATGESLDKLVKGALAVIAEHPDLMGIDNPGIERIVRETVTELASRTQKIGPDLFPDIAQLVLEKTAANLDLFWTPDDPEQNLAVTAVRSLLRRTIRHSSHARWPASRPSRLPSLQSSLVLPSRNWTTFRRLPPLRLQFAV